MRDDPFSGEQPAIIRLVAGRVQAVALGIGFERTPGLAGPLRPAEAAARARHGRVGFLQRGEAAAFMAEIAENGRRIVQRDFEVPH